MTSVAIIGSFRQHYQAVLEAIETMRSAGIEVTSPAGAEIVEPDIAFVRFVTDPHALSDAEVQTVTLKKIFSAAAVYVVAPQGYVGRTTCYEIGRAIQAQVPIYFSAPLIDLPIEIPSDHIVGPEKFAEIAKAAPTWPFHQVQSALGELERELASAAK